MPNIKKTNPNKLKHHVKINKLNSLAAEFRKAMATANYPLARRCCEDVLALTPGNPSVLGDYALTLMRTGEYQKAYEIYRAMFANKAKIQYSGNWMDGLAEVCGWLGKHEELQRYGCYSLEAADSRCRQGVAYPLPSECPPKFSADKKSQNIISFSLYGANPRYCETLIKNAELSAEFYPDWICRVYHDDTVPQAVLNHLHHCGVQLIDMSDEKTIPATLWRFLVIDDPQVSRYLVRDADALFSEKEVAAVQQWLESRYWFHHMRDYFTHTELLLAGMWGGCNGVFPSVKKLIQKFIAGYQGSARFTDQYFLRTVLWPTIRTSILNHDEIFLFHHPQPYPKHPPVRWKEQNFHIGGNASYAGIGGEVIHREGGEVLVTLKTSSFERGYLTRVTGNKWQLPLPFFLIEEYKNKKLAISITKT